MLTAAQDTRDTTATSFRVREFWLVTHARLGKEMELPEQPMVGIWTWPRRKWKRRFFPAVNPSSSSATVLEGGWHGLCLTERARRLDKFWPYDYR